MSGWEVTKEENVRKFRRTRARLPATSPPNSRAVGVQPERIISGTAIQPTT